MSTWSLTSTQHTPYFQRFTRLELVMRLGLKVEGGAGLCKLGKYLLDSVFNGLRLFMDVQKGRIGEERGEDGLIGSSIELKFHNILYPRLFKSNYCKPVMQPISEDGEGLAPLPPAPIKLKKNSELAPYAWDLFFDEFFYLEDGTSVFRAGNQGPVLFCIHGAGHSALSFATFARQAKKFSTVLAIDYRGHGMSKIQNDPFDMSIETLVKECESALEVLTKKFAAQNFIVVGHSLGGSIASRIVDKVNPDDGGQVNGLVVIDVVEGTALEALPFMMTLLNKRPKDFNYPQQAIAWSLASQTLKNRQSARISIPAQLQQLQKKDGRKVLGWKVPLQLSEKFWKGWFEGLSDSFLKVKVSKILFTAEKERLDSKLMVAQMQGRFRLSVIHNVGHSVQEDDYQATTKAIYEFIKIFKIPPTVSQSQRKLQEGIGKYKPVLIPY